MRIRREIELRTIPSLAQVDPNSPDAANLWRVHWFNGPDRKSLVDIPGHIVLPPELTGVKAPIVVLLGCRFPMIGAHKVLAAYACLVPRLVTGQFDPSNDRAIWPSTGNYCRGGVAISRILGCRGVAVLPAGMSRERFDWLQRWVADPRDIIRTPGPKAMSRKSTTNARNFRETSKMSSSTSSPNLPIISSTTTAPDKHSIVCSMP